MMNTEAILHEKGANIIKLPSIGDILKNIRYFLSGLILVLSVVGIFNQIRQNMLSKDSMIILTLLFLSGWVLATVPFKNIIQPYKDKKNSEMQKFRILIHITLTVFWVFGLIMGIYFLVAIISLFIK